MKRDYRVKQITEDLDDPKIKIEERPTIDEAYGDEDRLTKCFHKLLGFTVEEQEGKDVIIKRGARTQKVVDEMYKKMPFCSGWRMITLECARPNKKQKFDVLFVKQSTKVHSNIRDAVLAARESYIDERFYDCAEQLKHALSNSCFPDKELYAWIGCTYTQLALNSSDEEEQIRKTKLANNCFRVYNHLKGLRGKAANFLNYANYETVVGSYLGEVERKAQTKSKN